jgi:hypothetical protein
MKINENNYGLPTGLEGPGAMVTSASVEVLGVAQI